MNISNLIYFVEIVNCDFNLTKAAQKSHISQPALSSYIKTIEKDEGVVLFHRQKGRLVGLTSVGERFFENAKVVISSHEQLMADLRSESKKYKGEITIGIPQLISGIVFSELIPRLIEENPDVKFNIVETGAYELQKKLFLKEVDFAILLTPTTLDSSIADIDILLRDQLYLYMSEKTFQKKFNSNAHISIKELHRSSLVTFDSTFMINHQLMTLFEEQNSLPTIKFCSASWDFLLNSTRYSSYLTILPRPITHFAHMDGLVEIQLTERPKWEVVLASLKHHKTSHLKTYIKHTILDYFTNQRF
ncbi:LysR family transcriptional regulator [Streptococcus dysgalactiae]|uniref:LysR family transcriptional regulator n=1 Tax=Streptococcus dysgalactiae TaxID=1334 RepID=A0AAE9UMF3_STRDY|nr:LysR family transcriptional regulator [Streptococcus dysgalactiae]QGH04132.1 LysR family transcriptional regulator [Streptococcus dysgalactiae subsp. dysgalactiae]WAI93282.1 LysR family transcriptional regulator [Streptococcus dysgalactiae]WCE85495.1 LysR family transcriptional regulator [Streptococcus dysgalactiae]WCN25495.1 LysR family transcriptional regulator [Streptococcus dysgalactiae]BBE39449.1 HTH-type transcriptional regulator CysB [Streptococcus dysgalactiae]